MSEEKPKDKYAWSSFYDAAKARLEEFRSKRASEKIRTKLATQTRLDELSDKVRAGDLARKFLESDFWVEYLEPYLRQESVLRPWSPKDSDPAPTERAFQDWVFGSGQAKVMGRLLEKMERWQEEGAEAEKILQAEAKRRQELDKLARTA